MAKIAFFVNGGLEIGMGHIMRCLALADEFRVQGCELFFVSTAADGIEKIRSFGYAVENPTDLFGFFKTHSFDMLMIDSYDVTPDFFLKLKSLTGRLGYIDDLNAFTYPVDLLVNGNIYVKEADYKRHMPDEVLLVGTEYNLIRQEFRELLDKEPCGDVKSILLLNGSTDTNHMCSKIADMILSDANLADLQLNIAAGQSSAVFSDLYALACRHPNVTLYTDYQSMSRLMLESELAISAAGSTLYELCACGVPALSFIVAENQTALAEYMDKHGLVKCLGWYHKLSKDALCSGIKSLSSDQVKRKNIHSAMRRLVDGYGAKRAAQRIMEIICSCKEMDYGR